MNQRVGRIGPMTLHSDIVPELSNLLSVITMKLANNADDKTRIITVHDCIPEYASCTLHEEQTCVEELARKMLKKRY